jgi:cytochrome c peroxidase
VNDQWEWRLPFPSGRSNWVEGHALLRGIIDMDAVRIFSAITFVLAAGLASAADEMDRSPLSLAVSSDRSVCLTANHTGGSVSLVELPVGKGPADVAWIDDSKAVVSLLHEDALVIVSKSGHTLKVTERIKVGDEPRGLALSPDRSTAYVALGGDDAVAVVALNQSKPITRIATPGIPKSVQVSANGRWLVTCTAVPATVYVHDMESGQMLSERRLFDGAFNPGIPTITKDSQLLIIPHAVNREFSVTAQMIDIGWVIDNRISKMPLPDGEPSSQKQLGLDIRGHAVGDAYAAVFNQDETRLVVTCGGTHELLVIDYASIPWPKGDPGDFLPAAMQKDPSTFRRIKVGGRPQAISMLDDGKAIVANYLANCLQVIDLDAGEVVRTIPLGGPADPSLARLGEAIFYDADRSMHSWFSCHTCHTDGHTAAQVFDTRNDKSYGTPKLTPSLRGVAETGPWTWHGWQTSLHEAMKTSLSESMSSKQPITDDDATALVEYLKTVNHPVNPRAESPDAVIAKKQELGRSLFTGKAGCATCHAGPQFTSDDKFDGKVEDRKDRNTSYNPPTLRGVSTRRRFLHTGKARSLDAVLTKYHRPEDLVGESLSDDEREALIEFLKSL